MAFPSKASSEWEGWQADPGQLSPLGSEAHGAATAGQDGHSERGERGECGERGERGPQAWA